MKKSVVENEPNVFNSRNRTCIVFKVKSFDFANGDQVVNIIITSLKLFLYLVVEIILLILINYE